MARDPDKPSLSERLTRMVIKADTRPDRDVDESPQTLEEIEAQSRGLDDTERLIGLAAAPLAGLIAILVVSSYGSKGQTHATSVDSSLFLALFGLALVALACAWFRKRLFLGIVLALYGLSVFNLHYWGFGVPFLLIGSWYLVRAYRIQQKLKLTRATADPADLPASGGRPAAPHPASVTPRRSPARPSRPTPRRRPSRRRRLNRASWRPDEAARPTLTTVPGGTGSASMPGDGATGHGPDQEFRDVPRARR